MFGWTSQDMDRVRAEGCICNLTYDFGFGLVKGFKTNSNCPRCFPPDKQYPVFSRTNKCQYCQGTASFELGTDYTKSYPKIMKRECNDCGHEWKESV